MIRWNAIDQIKSNEHYSATMKESNQIELNWIEREIEPSCGDQRYQAFGHRLAWPRREKPWTPLLREWEKEWLPFLSFLRNVKRKSWGNRWKSVGKPKKKKIKDEIRVCDFHDQFEPNRSWEHNAKRDEESQSAEINPNLIGAVRFPWSSSSMRFPWSSSSLSSMLSQFLWESEQIFYQRLWVSF